MQPITLYVLYDIGGLDLTLVLIRLLVRARQRRHNLQQWDHKISKKFRKNQDRPGMGSTPHLTSRW
jgi:hypothetical protein